MKALATICTLGELWMLSSENLESLLDTHKNNKWWKSAFHNFNNMLLSTLSGHFSILYNADADGFIASYFIYKYLYSFANKDHLQIHTKAVWNFDYDFKWLPRYLSNKNYGTIICLDIPIIQEQNLLMKLSAHYNFVVYDHHMIKYTHIRRSSGILYLNSHQIANNTINYPTCSFAALFASNFMPISLNEYIFLSLGLLSDRSLSNFPKLLEYLLINTIQIKDANKSWDSPLGKAASQLNSIFRAWPGKTPINAQKYLMKVLQSSSFLIAFNDFCFKYKTDAANKKVSKDVDTALGKIEHNFIQMSSPPSSVLINIIEVDSFSVGIVASILAERMIFPIVAIGFKYHDKIQFELRTYNNAIDLTKVLNHQKRYFIPITSGGHCLAAGALIYKKDYNKFCCTINRSYEDIYCNGRRRCP
jgi:hypothetical protein